MFCRDPQSVSLLHWIHHWIYFDVLFMKHNTNRTLDFKVPQIEQSIRQGMGTDQTILFDLESVPGRMTPSGPSGKRVVSSKKSQTQPNYLLLHFKKPQNQKNK